MTSVTRQRKQKGSALKRARAFWLEYLRYKKYSLFFKEKMHNFFSLNLEQSENIFLHLLDLEKLVSSQGLIHDACHCLQFFLHFLQIFAILVHLRLEGLIAIQKRPFAACEFWLYVVPSKNTRKCAKGNKQEQTKFCDLRRQVTEDFQRLAKFQRTFIKKYQKDSPI